MDVKFELSYVIRCSVLSNTDILIGVHYSEISPAKIESIEITKIDNQINKTKTEKTFDLEKHKVDVTTISDVIDKSFVDSLESNCKVESIKYFNRGFFKNFLKKDPKVIIDKITSCNWIIVSRIMSHELSKSNMFKSIINRHHYGIVLSGKIGDVNVFTSELVKDNEIYIGGFDSITSFFNKNVDIKTLNSGLNITIEYLFVNNGIRKLLVI
jgi:hypothetical protein